tara:strand:- start:616 stop:948 length:333 start_codon:yes stop_codon:yes gene_type:complete
MDLRAKGKVKKIFDKVTGTSKTGNEWEKRDFVITTDGEYPKDVCFTTFGDKTSVVEYLKVGQDVEVFFDITSREHGGKYFHNVNAWKIGTGSSTKTETEPASSGGEDLPF